MIPCGLSTLLLYKLPRIASSYIHLHLLYYLQVHMCADGHDDLWMSRWWVHLI